MTTKETIEINSKINELYLKKLKRNKRYKKVPTELTKYNNQVL